MIKAFRNGSFCTENLDAKGPKASERISTTYNILERSLRDEVTNVFFYQIRISEKKIEPKNMYLSIVLKQTPVSGSFLSLVEYLCIIYTTGDPLTNTFLRTTRSFYNSLRLLLSHLHSYWSSSFCSIWKSKRSLKISFRKLITNQKQKKIQNNPK